MTWTVPALTDCEPGIEATEFTVLISMAEKPTKTAGGIILTDDTREREQWGSEHGRILSVAPLAFSYANWPDPSLKPQVGDVVFVGRHPGKEATGRDGKTYRLVSDREVLGIIERSERWRRIPTIAPALASDEVREMVEAQFAEVGPDISGPVTEDGNAAVVIANGAVKFEGTPAAPISDGVIAATMDAVRRQYPESKTMRLRWRRRPEIQITDGNPVLYLRLAADPINTEAQRAA